MLKKLTVDYNKIQKHESISQYSDRMYTENREEFNKLRKPIQAALSQKTISPLIKG